MIKTIDEKVKLIGFANPSGSFPSFVIPIYSNGHDHFVAADEYSSEYIKIDKVEQLLAVGDAKIGQNEFPFYAFAESPTDIEAAARYRLIKALDRKINSYKSKPFLYWEVASFIGEREYLKDAEKFSAFW